MSRTGKRGKAKLGRTSIEVTQIEIYTFQELFNIYMFAKEAEGLAKRTLENKKGYFLVFHRYLEERHEDVTPNTLDTNTIREFLYYLKNDHIYSTISPYNWIRLFKPAIHFIELEKLLLYMIETVK